MVSFAACLADAVLFCAALPTEKNLCGNAICTSLYRPSTPALDDEAETILG